MILKENKHVSQRILVTEHIFNIKIEKRDKDEDRSSIGKVERKGLVGVPHEKKRKGCVGVTPRKSSLKKVRSNPVSVRWRTQGEGKNDLW